MVPDLKTLRQLVIGSFALMMVFTAASRQAPPATASSPDHARSAATLEQLEDEIEALSTLSDDELAVVVQASVAAYESQASGEERLETKALPAVPLIVWAIGCGFAGISSVATNAWSTASGTAWAIAGVLVGCIPGVGQAAIVRVILANKGVIANALRAVGLTAPALALCGDSSC